ncbi:Phosphohydrolase, MUTT/NUDIX family protein [Candidatus Magnetomoraceae bacterium gMMP-1]
MKEYDLKILKKNLPECPGIQGKEEYFNAAVLVPLIMINSEYHLLFEQRSNHIRQGGEICFPGGEYDSEIDTSCKDAAIRETIEEIGVKKEQIKLQGSLNTFLSIGVTVDPFVGILKIQDLNELNIDKNEVARIFILPVSYFEKTEPEIYNIRVEAQPSYIDNNGKKVILLPAEELNLPERYKKPWGARIHKVFVYKTDEGIIWGLTAKLIYEFIQNIKS